MFRYRPTTAQAWPNLKATSVSAAKPWLLSLSESAHRISAYIALVVAAVFIATCLVQVWRSSLARRIVVVLGGCALVAGLVVGLVQGARLVWDQLALGAVTTKTPEGVWLPAATKFVLIGVDTVSPGSFRTGVWIHVLVLPVLVVLGVVLVVVGWRRGSPTVAASGTAPGKTPSLTEPART
jgi:hypothetical protein